jgi:hypothetical protein
MPSNELNRLFFLSSCVFAVEGTLQIILSLIDPLPLPIVQQLNPVAHFPVAAALFVLWLFGLAIFIVGFARTRSLAI